MRLISNPLKGAGLPDETGLAAGRTSTDAAAPRRLLARCPAHAPTPLRAAANLAAELGVGALYVKDERARMGLGSFKALGAAYVIAREAEQAAGAGLGDPALAARALEGVTYVTASAGNHGLSVAAGARLFGARAVIYLSETVPMAFAARLREKGAEVRVRGADYEASMEAAAEAAAGEGFRLLSDSTWEGYSGGIGVMEGYLALAAEVAAQIPAPPSHVFLQAGVGGLAAAMAAYARDVWGDAPRIVVVEPERAACLMESALAGGPVHAAGAASNMGRLDCKEPSHVALKLLAREADAFMTLPDDFVAAATRLLADHGLAASPSGAAGLAGLFAARAEGGLGLDRESQVLTILSEGPADA